MMEIVVRSGTEAKPGELNISRRVANPLGNIDVLYVFDGDTVNHKIERVVAKSDGDVPPPQSRDAAKRLTIFHFNDLHNHLSELSGEAKGTHRFSQMVWRVNTARDQAGDDEIVMFLSAGDDHTGSVLDELLGWRAVQFVVDASYRAYSAGGVDFSTLGNHEFDRGSKLLAMGIRQDARFPLLSANVHSSAHLEQGKDYFPAAIAVCKGLRIGFIGLTTHIETRVGQSGDPTMALASPLKVIENILPVVAEFADVIVILSHCGFGDGEHKSGKAAANRDIGEADFSICRVAAALTDKPLLLIGAHTHTRLNEFGLEPKNVFDRVAVLQAECNGKFIGEINLMLDGGSPRRTLNMEARLHTIKPRNDAVGSNDGDYAKFEHPDDYDVAFEEQQIAPLCEQVGEILNHKIADVQTAELSFKQAVLARYAHESALVNFMCDAVFERTMSAGYEVDLAIMNGATIQAGIEPGALSMAEWFDVMPYADEIYIVTMSGAQILSMLQSNANRVLRPEEIATTDYHGFLPRGFMHTSKHLRYTLVFGQSAVDASVSDVEFCGADLQDLAQREFKVVMSTYLALGGFGERWNGRAISGGVPGEITGYDLRKLPSHNTGLVYRNEVAAYIQNLGQFGQRLEPFCDGRLILSDG